MRVPNRSDSAPQKNAATPMQRKSSVDAAETPARDQPIASEIGCRNTASDSIVPKPDAGHQRARADDDPAIVETGSLLMRFLAFFCGFMI